MVTMLLMTGCPCMTFTQIVLARTCSYTVRCKLFVDSVRDQTTSYCSANPILRTSIEPAEPTRPPLERASIVRSAIDAEVR
jgi:hypothetical protein